MKKMMIMAAFIAVAISANAQNRYDNGSNYNAPYPSQQAPYGNGSYGNNTYGRTYDNNNGGYYQNGRENAYSLDGMLRETQFRLEKGIQRGTITKREARSLYDQFRDIKEKKYHFERNGYLEPREQQIIMSDLADLNRRIEHEKHDGENYGTFGRGYDEHRHGEFGEGH